MSRTKSGSKPADRQNERVVARALSPTALVEAEARARAAEAELLAMLDLSGGRGLGEGPGKGQGEGPRRQALSRFYIDAASEAGAAEGRSQFHPSPVAIAAGPTLMLRLQ